jgi:hypothetical protein
MLRKSAIIAVAIGCLGIASPAFAGDFGNFTGSTSTSGGADCPPGTTSSSGGSTSSSSGTEVPEPGMLGLAGLGLMGLGTIRMRRRRK